MCFSLIVQAIPEEFEKVKVHLHVDTEYNMATSTNVWVPACVGAKTKRFCLAEYNT